MPPLDIHNDLVALFRQQVQRTPTATAVEDGTISWTYAELDRIVTRLARKLRREHGVGRDSLVGVLMDHGAPYVAACLAAMAAGGAFLVLETAYPAGQLADVMFDAKPAVVLSSAALADRLASAALADRVPGGVPCIVLGDLSAESDGTDAADHDSSADDDASLPPPTDLDRLAFVSYSSGSTGLPKGIANPHSAAVRSYALRFGFSDLGPGDRVACNVFFVWEMLRPLLRGATSVAVPDAISYDPVALVHFLARHAITETLMTPTLLATVLARYDGDGTLAARLPTLATLWLNGEVVSVNLARRAAAALPPRVRLLNCYSASETHEIACGDLRVLLADSPTATPGDEDTGICPVGAPLDPDHVYVVDEAGQRVPPGVSGELYVGGDLLARGYINRPETTAAVFLPDVFSPDGDSKNRRMYRSGDRARMLPSGALEISGRVGGMIKIRGYTVHPAAVESAVVRHLAVRSCVVVADGDGLARQLVAYVVPEGDAASDCDRPALVINAHGHSPLARRRLAEHLAHYMIPVHWVALERLPTHDVSGKVDLHALPRPRRGMETPAPETASASASASAIQTPRDGTATSTSATTPPQVCTIDDIKPHWAASLGLDEAAAATTLADATAYDFFDLGGHSLALAALAARLSTAYGVMVPLLELARTPTLAGHAAAVEAAVKAAAATGAEEREPLAANDVDTRLLRAMLAADCVLEGEDEAPAATKPTHAPVPVPPIGNADTIFLTGATGFLGAFLLDSLLALPSQPTVLCLVRAPSRAAGLARLRRHLLGLGLWRDAMAARIEVVVGDLARPRLGLPSAAAWTALAMRVRAIVHAGARVNLVYPYEALRDANVGGTRAVLALAAASLSGPVPVHYISTNGVLPPSPSPSEGWTEDAAVVATVDDVAGAIPDGYGQSKWVAEQLVGAAIRRGQPARIYRPGTLGGHSRTGATNPRDVVTALLCASLRLGAAPTKPSVAGAAATAWNIEMTPVDHVSDTIVALANVADDAAAPQTVFHVGSPVAVPAPAVFAQLATLGYATEAVDHATWVARWTASQAAAAKDAVADDGNDDDALTPAAVLQAGVPAEDVLTRPILLADTQTKAFLARARAASTGGEEGAGVPPVSLADRDLLATYTRHFYARGWLDKGPSEALAASVAARSAAAVPPHRPLAGKVAVVTGASSGIGAAVAEALAREGVHVAVAARRLDELQALRARLTAAYPDVQVLAQATDVTDAAQVQALVTAAGTTLGTSDGDGGIDILVACAGVMYFTMMGNVRMDEWTRTVDVNCKGLLHCLAAAVPPMLARKRAEDGPHPVRGVGHIVAISSDAGRKVFPGLGVYSGSKFFVEAVLQSLRLETAGTGLRVTSVQPGNTATPLLGLSTDPEAMAAYGTPTGARVLDPADVAGAVVYALRQPAHVAVNEVLIEPRDEPI